MDKYLIDHHKIMYHPERIALWLKAQTSWEAAKKLYPIYAEISLSQDCNHACRFCAFDYLRKEGIFANFENLKKAIKDMAQGGVKSINFSGEGEPLLHPRAREIIKYAKKSGFDLGLTTNGSLLSEKLLKEILPYLTWLRVSLDAARAETHFKIHRPRVPDFERIISNLKEAVKIKKSEKLSCTLGVQMLLLPDNWQEAVPLARLVKKIGVDYLVIKPYSQHPQSKNRYYENISYEKYLVLSSKLLKEKTKNFEIIFREKTMKRLHKKRGYSICHSVPFFWVHLATNGDVYSCGNFVGDLRFKLGNYNEKSFKEIWEGERRKEHIKFILNEFDLKECRKNCRMDKINCYLEKLRNPPPHVNFI